MALMNTLRNKMGKVVVGAVAVAIMSFVLTDLLGPNSKILGGQDTTVGEIAGNTINYDEYQNQVEKMREDFFFNFNRNPTEQDMPTIREQAWERLISDLAFGDEYEKLGVKVTREELIDMVQGNNVAPALRQVFTNPETGEFDKENVKNYLRNWDQLPPQQQAAWANYERNLGPGRIRIKYENLLVKTDYVPQDVAVNEYHSQTDVAEIKYLFVPFVLVNDSLIDAPTNSDLEQYLSANAEKYEVEETRTFKYVTFPIDPSSEDSAFFQDEMEKLKAELVNISDDSIFARNNSDNPRNAFQVYTPESLPQQVADLEEIQEGTVIGPVLVNQFLTVYKVSEVFEDTVYSARASHILIKWDEDTPAGRAAARSEAQGILNEIKAGADFADMAREHGTDGTAVRGGDLGWFTEGRMVEPFENAVMAASQTGLLGSLVETQFGYHIIDVTAVKTNINYKIASIEREITAGDQTINEAYRKAEFFALDAKDEASFDAKAKTDSLTIRTALNIGKNARSGGGLADARQIVQWLYRDAEVGEVSEVFELDNQYVVAAFSQMTEEGTNDLANVRNEVELKVKNERKGEAVKAKLAGLSGSLDEIAAAYGAGASVYSTPDLKISSNSLNSVGLAPEAVGVAFALEAGNRSEPIAVENGVVIVELVNFTKAPEIADYTIYKDQVQQRQSGRTAFNITSAVKEFAEIEDERYKFY